MNPPEHGGPPLVSVVMPCYNQAHYLREAVGSLQRQSYPHWECIIVDDGSSDETSTTAADIARGDSRIRSVRQDNRGLAAARNRGLDEARGAFVQFLDADDLLLPEKLTKQVAPLRLFERPGLAYCRYSFLDETVPGGPAETPARQGRLDAEAPVRDLILHWENGLSIPCQAFLFDARLFHDPAVRFDEELPNHEDWECWMRVLARQPRIVYVNEILAIYRRHGGAMSRDRDAMRRGWLQALRKQYALLQHEEEVRALLARRIRGVEREIRSASGAPAPRWAGMGGGLASALRLFLAEESVDRVRRFLRREPPLDSGGRPGWVTPRVGHRLANVLRGFLPEDVVRRVRRFLRRNPEL